MTDIWERIKSLSDQDRQRAMLHTFVRMHLTVDSMQKYTHVRAEIGSHMSGLGWKLMIADDDSVTEEKEVEFGSSANALVKAVIGPFIKEQPYSLARLAIRFSPPTLQIDVLNDTNTPIWSGKLIDLDMEAQIRAQLQITEQ